MTFAYSYSSLVNSLKSSAFSWLPEMIEAQTLEVQAALEKTLTEEEKLGVLAAVIRNNVIDPYFFLEEIGEYKPKLFFEKEERLLELFNTEEINAPTVRELILELDRFLNSISPRPRPEEFTPAFEANDINGPTPGMN